MAPENDAIAISQPVADLVILALNHAMASRQDSASVVPFVLIEGEGGRYIHRFVADTDEQAVAEAEAFVARQEISTTVCAIAYDGTITVEGTQFDAILVIGGERGAPSYVFAQRYDATATPLAIIGAPAIIGTNDSLLDTSP